MTLKELVKGYDGDLTLMDSVTDNKVCDCTGESPIFDYIGNAKATGWKPAKKGNNAYVIVYVELTNLPTPYNSSENEPELNDTPIVSE